MHDRDAPGTTRAFTAVLALQLVDAKRIDLDPPIAPYFPRLMPAIAQGVAVRHPLQHTSGIVRDYTEALGGDGPYSRRTRFAR